MGAESKKLTLNVRLTPANKGLIARAADLLSLNLTAFTVTTLVQKARQVVDEHADITLGRKDTERFLALLDNPPEPTAALRKAGIAHQESVIK